MVAGGGGGAEKKAKDDEAAAKRYIESLDKQREKVKELSEVEVALAEIQRIRAQGGEVTEAQKQRILQFAAEIDITKERTAAYATGEVVLTSRSDCYPTFLVVQQGVEHA